MLLLDVVVYDAYSMVVEIRLERFKCFKIAAVDGLCENGCLNKSVTLFGFWNDGGEMDTLAYTSS